MSHRSDRRRFLQNTASVGVGLWIGAAARPVHSKSPNDKLNLGIIGVASRGGANLEGVKSQNIVALCDVDEKNLAMAAEKYPSATKDVDWRRLLDRKDIDAVVVSTTDHTHAVIAVRAMRAGKHVYCEKPVGLSVEEARLLRKTAVETKRATQQGTQVHATGNFRMTAEMIRGGAIGTVREAHVWCTRDGAGWDRPTGEFAVPANLHWDLWLGPAPERPYHPEYFPGCAKWNKYWDFGGGVLGDMGSHLIDFPFAALNLKSPVVVEAEGAAVSGETYPKWLRVRWDHPAEGGRAAVKVYWYDGIQRPKAPKEVNTNDWHGILYVGDKGMLWVNYGGYALLPAEDPKNFKPPMPNVPSGTETQGHHDEWIHACKSGSPTGANFEYAGRLIEHNMLGIVALRMGKRIEWDEAGMKARGCPEAEGYIRRSYRKGWELSA